MLAFSGTGALISTGKTARVIVRHPPATQNSEYLSELPDCCSCETGLASGDILLLLIQTRQIVRLKPLYRNVGLTARGY